MSLWEDPGDTSQQVCQQKRLWGPQTWHSTEVVSTSHLAKALQKRAPGCTGELPPGVLTGGLSPAPCPARPSLRILLLWVSHSFCANNVWRLWRHWETGKGRWQEGDGRCPWLLTATPASQPAKVGNQEGCHERHHRKEKTVQRSGAQHSIIVILPHPLWLWALDALKDTNLLFY